MKYLFLAFVVLSGVTGCAAVRPVVRTVLDIATSLCESVAVRSQDRLHGLSVSEWCAIERNLEPFIDAVLAAERKAGLRPTP